MIQPLHRAAGRAIAAVLLLGLAPSTQADQFTVGQLMDALAHNSHRTATFTERKYISILDVPVESSGELDFVPPAHLEKRTLRPIAETLMLDGDVLVVERQGQRHVLRLKDVPEAAGMIESLRAILAGDRQALERVYRLSLEGSNDRWTLELAPRDARVASVIARIRMEGVRSEVRTVEIQQADGDRSVMSVRQDASR
jgi:hypothetical protein